MILEMPTLSTPLPARIGLYTAGLNAYWDQFEGLRQRLIDYGVFLESRMSESGIVFNYGLVDNETTGRSAGEWFNAKNVDIIFCHSATYFTSANVLPIHQICKAPVIILNLQPAVSMNYEKSTTGEWLAHCCACPIPEITNAFNRAGISHKVINGLLGLDTTPTISMTDEKTAHREEAQKVWKEIHQWIRAATVIRTLQHARFGYLGNNYSGMLDLYNDFTMMQSRLGIHVELLEMCDLNHHLETVTEKEIEEKIDLIHKFFEISGDSPSDPIARKPTVEQMRWSANIAVAQEKMVKEHALDALAYYYHGADDNHYEQVQGGFIVGHSLLTAQGVPCSGEGDLKTAVAMKICDTLGVGGSFSEIVAADYDAQTIIMGHDGPFHIKIASKKPVLRGMSIYHGKKGMGVSVEANVIEGNVTTLGINQIYGGTLTMIVSEGKSITKPILTIGNTQTHIDFGERPDIYMDKWFKECPIHHCAMAIGHNTALFEKVAYLSGIEYIYV